MAEAVPLNGAVPVPLNNAMPAPSAPPMNMPAAEVGLPADKPSLAETKYIKRGSYGCAVNPALPNKVNGEWKTFPDHISKLYFKPKTLEKAITDSNSIYNLFGKNKGHKLNSYTYKNYKGRNLPKSVRNSCRIKEGNNLHVVRMPHLGYDIDSISAHYKEYRTLPFKKILEQTLKVVRQLRDLAAVGKVHGDIREPNVMANPVTGDITIIDFDFLNTAQKFSETYPFGFYSNPPESLLIDRFDDFKNIPDHRTMNNYMELIKAPALEYINKANNVLFRSLFHPINEDTIVDILFTNKNYMVANMNPVNNKYSEFMKMELPYFDSYGLGFTLLEFYWHVYNVPSGKKLSPIALSQFKERYGGEHSDASLTIIYNTIQQVVTQVLWPMCHPYISHRITINAAYDKLAAIVAGFVGVEGGARRRKTLRKRKSVKRK